jgi:hypothetical protein
MFIELLLVAGDACACLTAAAADDLAPWLDQAGAML